MLRLLYILVQNHSNLLFFFHDQATIQSCSTGPVGIEDSADGSAMLRSTLLVIMVVLADTGITDVLLFVV